MKLTAWQDFRYTPRAKDDLRCRPSASEAKLLGISNIDERLGKCAHSVLGHTRQATPHTVFYKACPKNTANIQRTQLEERRMRIQHSEVQKGVSFVQKMKKGSTAHQEKQQLEARIATVLQRLLPQNITICERINELNNWHLLWGWRP